MHECIKRVAAQHNIRRCSNPAPSPHTHWHQCIVRPQTLSHCRNLPITAHVISRYPWHCVGGRWCSGDYACLLQMHAAIQQQSVQITAYDFHLEPVTQLRFAWHLVAANTLVGGTTVRLLVTHFVVGATESIRRAAVTVWGVKVIVEAIQQTFTHATIQQLE